MRILSQKNLVSIALVFFLLVGSVAAFAQTALPQHAPMRLAPAMPKAPGPGELPRGFMPDPYQSPTLAPGNIRALRGAVGAPVASWDWRALGGVTAVKNQGAYGTCWIFAGMGDLESKVKIAETPVTDPDYAEQDIIEGVPEGVDSVLGGNPMEVASHLAMFGTIDEADNAYGTWPAQTPIADYWNPPKGTPLKNVVEWHSYGNLEALGADVTALKGIVQAVGPVCNAVRVDTINTWSTVGGASSPGVVFSSGAWNSDWVVPYLTGTGDPDHAVVIVGWDDAKQWYGTVDPGSRGAWLVKNSWGATWGQPSVDQGYFWIAYGSAKIGNAAAAYSQTVFDYDADETHMYYDEFASFGSVGWPGPPAQYTVYMANLFTPVFTGSKELRAVDFWAKQQNLSYEIKIFDTWNGPSSSPSDQLGTQSGSVTDAGYYAIFLNTPVSLTSGDEICVQVKLTDPSNTNPYLIPCEVATSWFPNTVSSESGKCYGRYDPGFSWVDISPSQGDIGVRIRLRSAAEPTPTATATPEPGVTPTPTATPEPGATPTATATPRAAGAGNWMIYQ